MLHEYKLIYLEQSEPTSPSLIFSMFFRWQSRVSLSPPGFFGTCCSSQRIKRVQRVLDTSAQLAFDIALGCSRSTEKLLYESGRRGSFLNYDIPNRRRTHHKEITMKSAHRLVSSGTAFVFGVGFEDDAGPLRTGGLYWFLALLGIARLRLCFRLCFLFRQFFLFFLQFQLCPDNWTGIRAVTGNAAG